MPEAPTLAERAHEIASRYRSLARTLDTDDAAQASLVVGKMLLDVERAGLSRSDAAKSLAEDALSVATRLLEQLHAEH
jgi:hypothetical protein